MYPQSWAIAKLFTIFKKGDKRLPENYRGITIINCLAKVYDMVYAKDYNYGLAPFGNKLAANEEEDVSNI